MNTTSSLPRYTVNDRLIQFGDTAKARLLPYFQQANINFPPKALTFIAFKDQKQLDLFALDDQDQWGKIHSYPIQAASGFLGPKLREGDKQVPEGIYNITLLNPNSAYHVSLRVNYPNEFDNAMALQEGRTQLGSDIMIHGKAKSIGCLAMGDAAAEELFTLAALVGKENIKVIITPTDFRIQSWFQPPPNTPNWTAVLYRNIQSELSNYPFN